MPAQSFVKRWFTGESARLSTQAMRYAIVAFLGFVVDYVLLIALKALGMHYLWATGIAFVIGVVINYILSVRWAFRKEHKVQKKQGVVVFILINAVALGLTELCMWGLTDGLHIHYALSRVLTGIVTFVWNFFARRQLLFIRG